jgi:DNA helicase-2/ATP-dependent DNA helicase PcrA
MLINELKHYAEEEKPSEFIKRILNETGYQAMLTSLPDAEAKERTDNVQELISAAHQFEDDHPGSATIRTFLEEVTLSSAVDRWEEGEGSVTLMTMHAAKGLEFPVVFIVGLEEGILPHRRAAESESEMEEERRLLFVGITRAQKELFISHCRVREFRGTRSATINSPFLRELPLQGVERINDTGHSSRADQYWSDDSYGSRSGGSGYSQGGYGQSRSGYSRDSAGRSASPERLSETRPKIMTAADLARLHASASAAAGAESAAVPSGPKPNPGDFQIGTSVAHPSYGVGRVTALEGVGPKAKARVHFATRGEVAFVIALSPLKVLPGRKN